MVQHTQQQTVLALLVENNSGVLARVANLFGRRGYNIDSLTVSETNDPGISRITISTHGDEHIIDQIMQQTLKLIEVRAVRIEDVSNAIQRELLLVKIRTTETQRSQITEICEIYEAKIVDLTRDSLIVELTGKPGKITSDYTSYGPIMYTYKGSVVNLYGGELVGSTTTPGGGVVLADEISPDTSRLWDSKTGEKLDKDRFRRDLGGVEDAYREVIKRMEEHR